MNFRDSTSFNGVLVDLQFWKLFGNHDLLLSTVFGPKYYPRGTLIFLESSLGLAGSYS